MPRFVFIVLTIAALLAPQAARAQVNPGPALLEASAATEQVASAYFEAYMTRDWDAMGALLADDAHFTDPTAEILWGKTELEGSTAITEMFRGAFAQTEAMNFTEHRRIFTGAVAVFEGDLHVTGPNPLDGVVTTVTPMVVILTVKDGKVVSHRDYADYAAYFRARAAAQQ